MQVIRAAETTPEALRSALERGEHFWLDVDSRESAQHALLGTVFHFHPLAIEDTLNHRTRVKVEAYEGYIFVVLRAMSIDGTDALNERSLDVSKLCIFLGERYVVSVHAGPSPIVDTATERMRHSGVLAADDAGRVAHAICDVTIDDYFPILDRVDTFVDRLERTDLADLDRSDFREILGVRRLAFTTRRSLMPQRAIFDELAHRPPPLLSRDAQLYFRDVYDHTERVAESLEAYHELMGTTTDAYVAQLSTRLDYATTVFSAFATIALPFVVISGLYGMNIRGLPFSYVSGAFWIILALQIAISLTLYGLLRRRHLV